MHPGGADWWLASSLTAADAGASCSPPAGVAGACGGAPVPEALCPQRGGARGGAWQPGCSRPGLSGRRHGSCVQRHRNRAFRLCSLLWAATSLAAGAVSPLPPSGLAPTAPPSYVSSCASRDLASLLRWREVPSSLCTCLPNLLFGTLLALRLARRQFDPSASGPVRAAVPHWRAALGGLLSPSSRRRRTCLAAGT